MNAKKTALQAELASAGVLQNLGLASPGAGAEAAPAAAPAGDSSEAVAGGVAEPPASAPMTDEQLIATRATPQPWTPSS